MEINRIHAKVLYIVHFTSIIQFENHLCITRNVSPASYSGRVIHFICYYAESAEHMRFRRKLLFHRPP